MTGTLQTHSFSALAQSDLLLPVRFVHQAYSGRVLGYSSAFPHRQITTVISCDN